MDFEGTATFEKTFRNPERKINARSSNIIEEFLWRNTNVLDDLSQERRRDIPACGKELLYLFRRGAGTGGALRAGEPQRSQDVPAPESPRGV